MKKNYLTTKITGTALFVLFIAACTSPERKANQTDKTAPIPVTAAHASATGDGQINITGQISSTQVANISTRVMGYITAMHVQVGDHVKQGQLLVSISSQDISAKKAQAEAAIAAAEAAYNNARKDLDRFTTLFKQQSATQKELDNVTLQYHAAQSQLQAAKAMRNEAGASLAYANITAPFTGVITQKMADAGSMAGPGQPLLTLEKSGSYQVSAYLTEGQVGMVKEGVPISINVPSAAKTFKSRVSQISVSAEGGGGQYLVKADIPDGQKSGLYAGMSANVIITLPGATSAVNNDQLMVPASAIVHQDELSGLYIISPSNTVLLRWVRLGKTAGSQVEVLSGLNNKELFVTQAYGRLYNGAPVSIK